MVKVSIIMAVYNSEKYLKEAVDSVLNQSLQDFELIVIDDGSSDSSLRILESYVNERLKIFSQPNAGAAQARNLGIKRSRGKYIAIFDSDDICFKDRLKIQFEFLEKNPQYSVVGRNADVIDEYGSFITKTSQLLDWPQIESQMPHPSFIHSTVMFRRSLIKKIGYYPALPTAEDAMFLLKASKVAMMCNISESLIAYRISPEALSRRSRRLKRLTVELLKDANNFDSRAMVEFKEASLKEKKTFTDRYKKRDYAVLVSKKLLWGSAPNPNRARLVLKENMGAHILIDPESLVLYFLSFININLVKKLYNKFKKIA